MSAIIRDRQADGSPSYAKAAEQHRLNNYGKTARCGILSEDRYDFNSLDLTSLSKKIASRPYTGFPTRTLSLKQKEAILLCSTSTRY